MQNLCTIKAEEHHYPMSTHSSADTAASVCHLSNSPSFLPQSLLSGYDSAWISCVAIQRPPIRSADVTQWPHIFADCPCCHPKTQHFLVKCGLFNRSHPKTPYFLHSAATGSCFLFQFHRQIDHVCHFRLFFQIPFFLKRSLKDQK